MRTPLYAGQIERMQQELADAEAAYQAATDGRKSALRARIASIRRSLRWYQSRSQSSPSPQPADQHAS